MHFHQLGWIKCSMMNSGIKSDLKEFALIYSFRGRFWQIAQNLFLQFHNLSICRKSISCRGFAGTALIFFRGSSSKLLIILIIWYDHPFLYFWMYWANLLLCLYCFTLFEIQLFRLICGLLDKRSFSRLKYIVLLHGMKLITMIQLISA